MSSKAIVQTKRDHVVQWSQLKKLYAQQRDRDIGRNNKAIPRTTNGDIKQLATYWHGEYLREVIRNPKALDRDLGSRKRWIESKRTIDRQIAKADPKAVYTANEWFWQEASLRLAIYLESRKAIPNRADLFIESVTETVSEGAEAVGRGLEAATGAAVDTLERAGKKAWSALKIGALVVGGIAGVAVVAPPVIRAFRDDKDEKRK